MIKRSTDMHYSRVSRYSTSGFMRIKLGKLLTREVRPHTFESKSEAHQFHDSLR